MQRKKVNTLVCALAATFAACLLGGCASIVNGGPGKVSVKSQPNEAKISVFDSKGVQFTSGITPMELRLDRGAGYFTRARYTIRVEKDGFRPFEMRLEGSINGWYAGNLVFGGLIGFLIVDPLTGAMWKLQPKEVDANLVPAQASIQRDPAGLVVVLRDQVSPSTLAHGIRMTK